MLTVLISCLIFSCFLLLGNVLMFVTSVVYGLIPFFALSLLPLSHIYRKANCKPLEWKDYGIALILTLFFLVLLYFWQVSLSFALFWYIYLSVFVAIELYAGSRRFKSLQ